MVVTKPDFDVAIIGGGPAGGSMGAYLAKAGVNCVVFERELFPRPHVGESLVPSAMRVFRDLDFLGQMEEAKFPHKFGAAWTAEDQGAYEMNFQGGFKDKDPIRSTPSLTSTSGSTNASRKAWIANTPITSIAASSI